MHIIKPKSKSGGERMNMGAKSESLRYFGTEILRITYSFEGFDGISEKITRFYESLILKAVSRDWDKLGDITKKAFETARNERAASSAFFKRYNYSLLCRSEKIEEKYLKVTISVSLRRASENLFYVENVHFWNVEGAYMMSENGIKKALLRNGKIVKK